MPIKDPDGGFVWQGYSPAVLNGVKAIPKDTYVSKPFFFGGDNIRSYIKPSQVSIKK